MQIFKIADLILAIDGPASYIHKNFTSFAYNGTATP